MGNGTMDIGVVGMGVMGSNLAFNMADHGFQVAGWNRTADMTEAAAKRNPPANFHPFYDLKEFIGALKKPRRVFLMIAAGDPVDWAIGEISPLLEPGDIILDGGNSSSRGLLRVRAKSRAAPTSARTARGTTSRWCITALSTQICSSSPRPISS